MASLARWPVPTPFLQCPFSGLPWPGPIYLPGGYARMLDVTPSLEDTAPLRGSPPRMSGNVSLKPGRHRWETQASRLRPGGFLLGRRSGSFSSAFPWQGFVCITAPQTRLFRPASNRVRCLPPALRSLRRLKYPEQESNLYLEFRKPLFYPLNYRDVYLSTLQASLILKKCPVAPKVASV